MRASEVTTSNSTGAPGAETDMWGLGLANTHPMAVEEGKGPQKKPHSGFGFFCVRVKYEIRRIFQLFQMKRRKSAKHAVHIRTRAYEHTA